MEDEQHRNGPLHRIADVLEQYLPLILAALENKPKDVAGFDVKFDKPTDQK
jgi:hypothetical protein